MIKIKNNGERIINAIKLDKISNNLFIKANNGFLLYILTLYSIDNASFTDLLLLIYTPTYNNLIINIVPTYVKININLYESIVRY